MTKTALVTGAAKRIGAVIASTLHAAGMNVVIHYHHSEQEAKELCDKLNTIRANSSAIVQGNVITTKDCQQIIAAVSQQFGQLNLLVNNASSFYATPFRQATETAWDDLMGSNVKGPFFLSQAAAPLLKAERGSIVNIVDIHAERPLKNYPIYSIAKAGLAMLTKSLARELGPEIRVNGVSPGPILWPEYEKLDKDARNNIISRTCLQRIGTSEDIANCVLFLSEQPYITGQLLAVDGGRNVRD